MLNTFVNQTDFQKLKEIIINLWVSGNLPGNNKILVIRGGICSGKSTLLDILKKISSKPVRNCPGEGFMYHAIHFSNIDELNNIIVVNDFFNQNLLNHLNAFYCNPKKGIFNPSCVILIQESQNKSVNFKELEKNLGVLYLDLPYTFEKWNENVIGECIRECYLIIAKQFRKDLHNGILFPYNAMPDFDRIIQK